MLQANIHSFPSNCWRHKITKAKESDRCDLCNALQNAEGRFTTDDNLRPQTLGHIQHECEALSENGQMERSGSESCRIQSQEGQELGSPAAAKTHIAQTSGVTQSVDLTNKGMGNHYLRDVQDVFALQCAPEDSMSDILFRLDI